MSLLYDAGVVGGSRERKAARTDIEFFWVAALVHGTKDAGNVLTTYDIAGGKGSRQTQVDRGTHGKELQLSIWSLK